MGIFDWFKRETDAQRIARAREAIAEDEPERALKILGGIDGDEARSLIDVARRKAERREPREPREARRPDDDGGIAIAFGADGSQAIGGVTFNAPKSDDDGRARRSDGLEVARALVAALAGEAGNVEHPTYPFVDAALLLARAGEPIAPPANPARARIVEMCIAAAAADHAKVIALAGPRTDLAVALVLAHAPALLAAIAPEDLDVLRAIAAVDRARAAEMLAAMDLDGLALGDATLAAIDCGLDHAALHARWPSLESLSAAAAHPWRALGVRRLARIDLDAALACEVELPALHAHDDDASHAVAARLAALDLPRALARADALEPDMDHVGWFRGCTGARTTAPDEAAGPLVDRWLDRLSPQSYDPYAYFRACVAAAIRLGDPVRVRRACELAGPTGWQIAHAARWDLARAPDPQPLLAALYTATAPGFVSARAVDGVGLAVGKVVVRPHWLRLADPAPHPIETLALVAALGARGPAWFPAPLP